MTKRTRKRLIPIVGITALFLLLLIGVREVTGRDTKENEHREIRIVPSEGIKVTVTPYPDFDLYNLSIIGKEGKLDGLQGNDGDNQGSTGDDQASVIVSGSITGNAERSDEGSEGNETAELVTDNSAILESEHSAEPEHADNNVYGSDGDERNVDKSKQPYTDSGLYEEPECFDEDTRAVEEGEGTGEELVGTTDSITDEGEGENLTYLGQFTATAYCSCEICCGEYASGYTASGTLATEGRTVACNSLPFGTQLMIDGVIYTVEDTGYSPYGEAWLDIFFDSHESALAFGLREVEVYLVN